jgi:osmotically-inducible protein OsmY
VAYSDYWRGERNGSRDERRSLQREWRSPDERERTPADEGFQRRGRREGSDYYGNDPQRYGAGNYDQFADRYYEGERRVLRGGSDEWPGGDAGWSERTGARGARSSSFNDRWQNSYGGSGSRAYAGYSGYGGGDYGERESDRAGFESSSFTGQGDDRPRRFDTGQFRGRGPKGYRRSDERIREDACECLTQDDHVDATSIEVTVNECEVTLTGSVSTREQKRRAETIIDGLPGVRDVHNRLRVMGESSSQGQQASEGSASQEQSAQSDQTRSGPRH